MVQERLELHRTKMTKKGKGRYESEYTDPKDPDRSLTVTVYVGTGYTPAVLDSIIVTVEIPGN